MPLRCGAWRGHTLILQAPLCARPLMGKVLAREYEDGKAARRGHLYHKRGAQMEAGLERVWEKATGPVQGVGQAREGDHQAHE